MKHNQSNFGSDNRYPTDMKEVDIHHLAKLYIDQYGVEASVKAAMTADAMLKREDTNGFKVWMQIGRVIEDMQATPEQRKR